MRLYALIVAAKNPEDGNIYIYSTAFNLGSFSFFRPGSIKASFVSFCRESVALPAFASGTCHTVIHKEEYTVHIQVSKTAQMAIFAFCDSSYPKKAAFKATDEVMVAWEKKMGEEWTKYRKDENIDIGIDDILKYNDELARAQEKCDEILAIMRENMRRVLENQENLERNRCEIF